MVTANPRSFRKVTRKAAYGVYATASKGRGGSISLQEIVWTTARTIAATGRAGKGKIEHCGYCGFEAMPGGSVKVRIRRSYVKSLLRKIGLRGRWRVSLKTPCFL
jgi:hypothetical protein